MLHSLDQTIRKYAKPIYNQLASQSEIPTFFMVIAKEKVHQFAFDIQSDEERDYAIGVVQAAIQLTNAQTVLFVSQSWVLDCPTEKLLDPNQSISDLAERYGTKEYLNMTGCSASGDKLECVWLIKRDAMGRVDALGDREVTKDVTFDDFAAFFDGGTVIQDSAVYARVKTMLGVEIKELPQYLN